MFRDCARWRGGDAWNAFDSQAAFETQALKKRFADADAMRFAHGPGRSAFESGVGTGRGAPQYGWLVHARKAIQPSHKTSNAQGSQARRIFCGAAGSLIFRAVP